MTSVGYKYNSDGLRSYKKVGSTVHEYEYLGDKLVYEKRGDLQFHYRYDTNGNLVTLTRVNADGTTNTAYVICNSRGDVEELRTSSGALYARYVYDSWGNVLHVYNASNAEITSTAHLANQNPFRYRGYYYDSESGLYYLQSRYYDPVTGRFISSDNIVIKTSIDGNNTFAYCYNNPIMLIDPDGNCPYNGTPADFYRLENGLPSLDCICNLDKSSSTKKSFVKVLSDSISINVGAGMGLGASIEYNHCSVQASVVHNIVEFEIDNSGINCYSTLCYDLSVKAGGFNIYSQNHSKMDLETNEFVYIDDQTRSSIDYSLNRTFGGSFYFIYGFKFEIEVDVDSILEYYIMGD